MKFLIFGGTGFVGKHLVDYLKSQGAEVVSASRTGRKNSISVDITKKEDFARIDFEPDVIVNCASRIPAKGKSSKDPAFIEELFSTNVVGSVNIANWAVQKKVPKLINCSTLVVVKKPWPNFLTEGHVHLPDGFHVGYAMSKLSQEQIMNECVVGSHTNVVHLRLSAVYGPGMASEGIVFKLLENLKQDRDVVLTDAKKNTLDLIHVEDVCKAIFAISRTTFQEKIINLANGNPVSISQLAETIKKITGSNSEIINKETESPESKSNIDVTLLKENIGEVYDDFVPLEKGLRGVVEEHYLDPQKRSGKSLI